MNVNPISITDVLVDSTTNAIVPLGYDYHQIHEGAFFTVHIDNTTASTDDHRTFVGFEAPAGTTWFHATVHGACSSAAEIFFVENVTIDDDEGTQVVALDRNRNTANTSTILSLEGTPTAGSVTWMTETQLNTANFSYVTLLDHNYLVAGSGPKALGGHSRTEGEFVLKSGLKYGVFIQNVGASANLHEISIGWKEYANE